MGYYSLDFAQICVETSSGKWTKQLDAIGKCPFAFWEDQWVGYEDEESIAVKMDYIKKEGFGGGMIWAIDLDDFRGVCGPKNPLISVMFDKLKDHKVVVPDPSTLTTTVRPGNQWWSPGSTTKKATISATQSTAKRPNVTPGLTKPVPTKTTVTPSTTTSTETSETDSTEATPDSIAEKCAQPGTQFVPHSDCTLYYWCVHEKPILQKCPKDTVWDNNALKCEWNYNNKDSDKCKLVEHL